MTTGSFADGQVFPAGSPEATLTMMFAIVLPDPNTRTSLCCGVPCILAQAASAPMSIGFRFGTLPS